MLGTYCIRLLFVLATGTALGAESSLLNEYTIRRWAMEDGLPETVVTSVQQLPDGYLWCTTPRYLLRFDGVRFVKAGQVPGGVAIPGTAAGAYRTKDGTLWWYGTAGALRNDNKEWLPVDFPGMLALGEADGQLWAATTAGMRWWDGSAFRGEASPKPVTTADVDDHGRFWLATGGKLVSFYDGQMAASGFPGESVTQVSVSPAGEFWVLTTTGLYCRRQAGWQAIALPVPQRQVTALLVDDDATLWLGTAHSLYRWRNDNWSDLTAREGLFPWDVRCLSLDDEGNVWVGTSGGLVRLHRRSLTVVRTGRPQGSESVTAFLAESSTNIWVGVPDGGLLGGVPGALRPVWPKALPSGTTVSAIYRGHDGTLWVGTQAQGLWRCQPDGSVTMVPDTLSVAHGITAVLEDRRGHLWVGTWDGLLTLSDGGSLVPAGITTTPDTVHALYADHSGRVWVGFQTLGLVCLAPDGTVRRYQKSDGLPGDSVRAILEDKEGTLWIGTSGGLARWASNQKSTFTTENGLVDDVILQLVEDDDGHLWLGTRLGIMRIKTSEFAEVVAGRKAVVPARQFNVDDGMADAECSGGMGARPEHTEDGRLWFPTQDGLVVVDPRHLLPEVAKPKVYIEEILARGQNVYQMPITMANEPLRIQLASGVRDLEFRVTTPVFSMPEAANFKYKLDGLDRNWSRATPDRSVRYEDLLPGNYQFHVVARDRDGEWNEAAQVVQVVVTPFIRETLWFRGAVGLLGIVLVVAVVHVWKSGAVPGK
jgi:ligand-binding sensor domain-containing protein